MLLEFINEPVIGPNERRRIRSHVMKGKNLGRQRSSRGRLYNARTIQRQVTPPLDIQRLGDQLQALDCRHTMRLDRLFWNDLILTSFPHEVTSGSEKFVYQWLWVTAKVLYPPEFCSELDLSQYPWFQYVLEDQAYFHCLLAVSASFGDHFGGRLKFSPDALDHISQAYRLVNEKLSGPEAYSDRAIAVVTVLAIYHHMHHQQSNGLIHFHGLRRMIQHRGGLAKLAEGSRALAQKPWRLALEFALQDGSPVFFSLNDVPSSTILHYFPDSQRDSSLIMGNGVTHEICPMLYDILLNITSLTTLLNKTSKHNKLNPMDYSEAVFFCLHRLLDFNPLGCLRCLDRLDDLLYLSLVAVMTTLLPEYGHKQARYDLLTNQLRCALRTYAAQSRHDHELFLWALSVGYVTVLEDKDHIWVIPLLGELCVHLNLHHCAEVEAIICQFPWISASYSKMWMRLWSKLEH